MGIVKSQSLKNLLSTYLGFGIGAINTLFLFTYLLTDTYYGLVTYLLSTANLMMPLMAFGVHNTLVKFYSGYASDGEQQKFTTMMLFLPAIVAIPLGIAGWLGFHWIEAFLTRRNPEVAPYIWTIFVIAFALSYFEVFYAWSKVHLQTVYGNFLKEVFPRLCIMILLALIAMDVMEVDHFIMAMVGVYVVRMLLMALSAFMMVKKPELKWGMPANFRSILKYTSLIIIGGSVAVVFLDIDRFMINQYKEIQNIAYYSVAVFIAVVIAVPARALHQITYPLTSGLMNSGKMDELEALYKKSSINLFLVSGLIFLLIVLNVEQLYLILPETYRGGITVVFLIAVAKLSDSILGNNNAIIYNSDHYRMVLFFGLFLAVLTILLNMVFIPLWGIDGAAFASLLAFLIYNGTKLWYVKRKMGISPFSPKTFKTFLLICGFVLTCYFWNFSFHPLLNIAMKSTLIVVFYLGAAYRLKLSSEVNEEIEKFIKKGTS